MIISFELSRLGTALVVIQKKKRAVNYILSRDLWVWWVLLQNEHVRTQLVQGEEKPEEWHDSP